MGKSLSHGVAFGKGTGELVDVCAAFRVAATDDWLAAMMRLSIRELAGRILLLQTHQGGNDTGDVPRCLKRYIAREVFAALARELRDQGAGRAAA